MKWKIGAAWKRVALAILIAGAAAFTAVQQQGPITSKQEWLNLLDSVIGSQPADSAGRHTQGERVVNAHLALGDEVYQSFARRWQSEFARELAAGTAGKPERFLSFARNIRRQAESEPYIKGRKLAPPVVVEPVDTCIGWSHWAEPKIWRNVTGPVLVSPQFWAPEIEPRPGLTRPAPLRMDIDRQVMVAWLPSHLAGRPFLCSDTDGKDGFPSCSNPTEETIRAWQLRRGNCAGCWEIPFTQLSAVGNRNAKVKLLFADGSTAYYNMFPGTEYVVFSQDVAGAEGMYPYINFRLKLETLDDITHYPDSTKARIRALQIARTAMVTVNVADWDICPNFERLDDGRFKPVPCRTPKNRMRGICVIRWQGYPGQYGIVRLEDIDPAILDAAVITAAPPQPQGREK